MLAQKDIPQAVNALKDGLAGSVATGLSMLVHLLAPLLLLFAMNTLVWLTDSVRIYALGPRDPERNEEEAVWISAGLQLLVWLTPVAMFLVDLGLAWLVGRFSFFADAGVEYRIPLTAGFTFIVVMGLQTRRVLKNITVLGAIREKERKKIAGFAAGVVDNFLRWMYRRLGDQLGADQELEEAGNG